MAEDTPQIHPEDKPRTSDPVAQSELESAENQRLDANWAGIAAEVGDALQKLLTGKALWAILGIVFLWSAQWDVHAILRGAYLALSSALCP